MAAKNIIADFAEEVKAMETDVLNLDNVKDWRMVRHGAGVILDAFERLQVQDDEALKVLARLFEQATLSSDVDRTNHDKVVALCSIAEDLNLNLAEMEGLLARWEAAADKLTEAMEGPAKVRRTAAEPGAPAEYGNTVDAFVSATTRGVKKYLTQKLGKGWYEANMARVTRLADGMYADDKGNWQEPFPLQVLINAEEVAAPAEVTAEG